MTCDRLWLFVLVDLTWSPFCPHFSDGISELTWQSDCAMWLLCLEAVRGLPSLGLGSVALLIFLWHHGVDACFSAHAIPMALAAVACIGMAWRCRAPWRTCIAALALMHLLTVLIKDDSSYMGELLCCGCAVCRGCSVSRLAQFIRWKTTLKRHSRSLSLSLPPFLSRVSTFTSEKPQLNAKLHKEPAVFQGRRRLNRRALAGL